MAENIVHPLSGATSPIVEMPSAGLIDLVPEAANGRHIRLARAMHRFNVESDPGNNPDGILRAIEEINAGTSGIDIVSMVDAGIASRTKFPEEFDTLSQPTQVVVEVLAASLFGRLIGTSHEDTVWMASFNHPPIKRARKQYMNSDPNSHEYKRARTDVALGTLALVAESRLFAK